MSRSARSVRAFIAPLLLGVAAVAGLLQVAPDRHSAAQAQRAAEAAQPAPSLRASGLRVAIDRNRVTVDDGDTVMVRWSDGDEEVVRILGIDCPETRHLEHDIPYGQPFGEEARAFAMGAFAAANRIEILRAATLDPYGRTLAYVFLDDRNYSTMVVAARLAQESISQYGDNGFPAEAAAVRAAATAAGPLAFEPPSTYRTRMSELSRWLKANGRYPQE